MDELKPCPLCGSKDVDVVGVAYDRRYFCVCGKCGYKSHEEYNEAEAIKAWNDRIIDDAPAVDAEPIRHGHWIEQTPEDIKYSWSPFICSVCSLPSGKHITNYCPNCGAKMDGMMIEYSDISNMWVVYVDNGKTQLFETYTEAVNYADAVRNLQIKREHER